MHDIGAGGEEVAYLLVHGRRVIHRCGLVVGIVVVLRLLGHRERAGKGDLDAAVGIGAQELHVLDLDRPLAADRARDSGHRVGMPGAVDCGAGVVDVDAGERGGDAVRVALAPDLAVRDDVHAGALLVADGEQRRIVLRLFEEFWRDPPQFPRTYPRRQAAPQIVAVDKPVRLHVAADHRRRQEVLCHFATFAVSSNLRPKAPVSLLWSDRKKQDR